MTSALMNLDPRNHNFRRKSVILRKYYIAIYLRYAPSRDKVFGKSMSNIAIFPASGKLASSVCTHLIKIIDPAKLIFISRNPEKIPSKYLDAGVTTRKADYNAPKSLEHVFDDVSCLLLLSYPSIESDHRFEVQNLLLFHIPSAQLSRRARC